MRLTPEEQIEELLSMISPIITREDTFMRAVVPAKLEIATGTVLVEGEDDAEQKYLFY